MKTRTPTSSIVLILGLVTLGAMQAQAIIVNWHPVAIAIGQTARVNILNLSDRANTWAGKFLDENGDVIAEFRGTIDPGKTMSFDLNRDSFIREQNRVEIHVMIEGPIPHLRSVSMSIEVFNNADGKTTVFVGDPNI